MKSMRYWKLLRPIIDAFVRDSAPVIEKAAESIFRCMRQDGLWHLFGSGHSALVVEEAFHRAGGLMPVNPMTDVTLSSFVNPKINRANERTLGYVEKIFRQHNPRSGEVLWVISNSGINASSIDMALAAKEKGLEVWAVTCVEHSKATDPRHPSGKRLFEVADHVIDTALPPGDAILEIPGKKVSYRSGAASLVIGAVLVHSVEELVIDQFVRSGLEPPIYMSSNLPGGDAHNKKLETKLAQRILRMRD